MKCYCKLNLKGTNQCFNLSIYFKWNCRNFSNNVRNKTFITSNSENKMVDVKGKKGM